MKNVFGKAPKGEKTCINTEFSGGGGHNSLDNESFSITSNFSTNIDNITRKRLSGKAMLTILFVLFLLIIGVAVGITYSAFQNTAQSNGTLSFAVNGHQGTLSLSNTKVTSYNSTDLTLVFNLTSDTNYNSPTITAISMGGNNLGTSGANFTSGSNIVATYSSNILTINRTNVTGTLVITGSSTASTYTITYNSNGGSGTMTASTPSYNSVFTLSSNTFTRTGYTFVGWALTSSGDMEYGDGAEVKDLGNKTLYAKWIANSYTLLIFNDRSGSVLVDCVIVNYGDYIRVVGNSRTVTITRIRQGYSNETIVNQVNFYCSFADVYVGGINNIYVNLMSGQREMGVTDNIIIRMNNNAHDA